MLKLQKPVELKSLNSVIHTALADKMEESDAAMELSDSIRAILAYKNASDEAKHVVDEVFAYLTRKPFALLMRDALESVKSQQKFCDKFVEALGLAEKVFEKTWY